MAYVEKDLKPGYSGKFVIHDHEASHHHWDLRLSFPVVNVAEALGEYGKKRPAGKSPEPAGERHEGEGLVLRSWAIPKHHVPTDKPVLATETEDHAIEYAKFRGCLEYYTCVITDQGPLKIGDIVNKKLHVNVLSYNSQTSKTEWKPVIDWFKNGKCSDWLKIRVPGQYGGRRVVIITPNHAVYTPKGIKHAGDLKIGDSIYIPGTKFSPVQEQVFLGTMLGDAHLSSIKQTQVPNFQLTHCGKQYEYLELKRDILIKEKRITSRTASDSHRFRFSHPYFINIYDKFYYHFKKKYINEDILNMLDERGLAIWYMDDGYLAQGKYVELCTHGFTKYDNQKIVNYLKDRWEIKASVYYAKPKKKFTGGYFVHFSLMGSVRFLTLINDYIIPCMRYKTNFKRYENRWVAEEEKPSIIPVKIISISEASKKEARSSIKHDISVKDNHNYFAGHMLVSNSIPEGEYGAGTVDIYDHGTYKFLDVDYDKKYVFQMNGKKIHDAYALIKTHGKQFMWIKIKNKSKYKLSSYIRECAYTIMRKL